MLCGEDTMRIALKCVWLVALLFAAACEHPKIFDNTDVFPESRSDRYLVRLLITGGVAGVRQELLIHTNGFVEFRDAYPIGARWSGRLSAEEVSRLQSAFIDNNFFRLDAEYLSGKFKDALYYTLTFENEAISKTVYTDYFEAPYTLQRILDALLQIKQELLELGLQMTFTADKDTLHSGEMVTLRLLASNRSGASLPLRFATSQQFNFYAIRLGGFRSDGTRSFQILWSWDADKLFNPVLQIVTLAPGEEIEFTATWDGRDDSGIFLRGELWVGGALVSIPGGSPPLRQIFIEEGQ